MKILQIVLWFPPAYSYGGPVKSVYELSKNLVEKGHDVTVFTTDAFDENSRFRFKENPTYMDGIKVYRFKNISNYLCKKNFAIAPSMALKLDKEIANFDLVHIHDFRSVETIFVHYYAKKYGVPYVLHPRGSAPTTTGKTKFKKLFDFFFSESIFNDASKIIASSKVESDEYYKLFPDLDLEKVVHVPNAMDWNKYQKLPNKGIFKNKYSIKDNQKVVLFLSRLHEIKGTDILIEAFAQLANEFDNLKLVVAGPDENGNLSKLKSKSKELGLDSDIIFPGPLYGTDKIEAYVDADVFVLPSRYDSFANVVLEACACGTPIIATDKCGVTEWIKDVGYIVECDVDQIKDAMYKLLKDDKLCQKFGDNARNLVYGSFGWDCIIDEIEDTYEDVIRISS
ncbi:glycosyltransferase [Methanococcoides seepicolus]|uniref:Glycosyltransferase n=1 Tax=Methanococcoides seepicolus TaxID=2828780 RepID=A0A9E5DC90_9EURY|nr:glycosyltransferase [Methanococcoides seepicolus]MCM1987582.1 glycosyltransferase [Methanococcoides seepicolus]